MRGLEVPENAVVVRHVPHGEVPPGAAATVTHGGHGTVAASLAHGVPLVCLPVPRIADQPPWRPTSSGSGPAAPWTASGPPRRRSPRR